MQKNIQNTVPPRQPKIEAGNQASPAFAMAKRIRNEQGAERARQYLAAMEPFLAPAERAHIAAQMGIEMPERKEQGQQPPRYASPNMGNSGAGGFGNAGNMGDMGNMGDAMQMMQMLSMLGGMQKGGGGGAGMNPMSMAQMLGGMLGKK